MTISVTRHASDGFTLSAIVGGYLRHKRYIGWTVREARADFQQFVKNS